MREKKSKEKDRRQKEKQRTKELKQSRKVKENCSGVRSVEYSNKK